MQEWRQQFQKLESVNLRYDNQVIVNPDMEGKPKQAALTAASARAAAAAGVKPAALITRLGPHERPLPKPAFELTEKKLDSTGAAKKTAAPESEDVQTTKPKTAKKTAPRRTRLPRRKISGRSAAAKGKTTSAQHSVPQGAKKPAASVAANASSPKPSAAVAKQQSECEVQLMTSGNS